MFLILWLNYRISKTASWGGKWTKAAPFVGWGFNLVVLFANEIYGGYQWGTLSDGLAFLVSSRGAELAANAIADL